MSAATPRQRKAIANWLLICCALVFVMTVLGGVTRLTGSGLSMVEWRPIMGALPPLSAAEWQDKFEIYQETPEFRHVNPHFDVDDFKSIFWLEYLHRLLGRLIGFAFVIPFVVFAVRGYIRPGEYPKYLLMLALGGAQAFVGKIMVASGQVDAPHVSQYKLTMHLAMAVVVYIYMFWVALSLLNPAAGAQRHPWFRRTVALAGLVTLTIVSGGFVAGLKAGLIYNTFPLMGGNWIPPGLMVLDPWWRNFFDNMTTVQFNHRILAITTLTLIIAYWWQARQASLPPRAAPATTALLGAGLFQVALGISTLLLQVPVSLAASHQGVALMLLTVTVYLAHSLRDTGIISSP
jgi:cytochrome c oxidase assembly protein subunit 15